MIANMSRKIAIQDLTKDELREHLQELKDQIETRLVGQQLADLSIHYTQDHSQDFKRDDLMGEIDLGSFVHDEILSTKVLFDSIIVALNTRIDELTTD